MRDLITAVLSFFYLILFFVYLYYAWQTIEWFKYKYMGILGNTISLNFFGR